MSNLILALLSSVPILHLAVHAGAQSSPSTTLPKAEDILAKLEADLGDPEARAKVRNLVIRGTMTMEGMPGEGQLEEIYAGADRARWNIGLPGCAPDMQSTQGTNGTFSWNADSVMGISILDGDGQGVVLRQFAMSRRAPWKSMYARAETVGKPKIDGRDAFEIRMIPAKGQAETWIVDAETFRLVCADRELPNPVGGSFAVRDWPSNWKLVDGVRYPFTAKTQFGARGPAEPNGFALVYEVKSIEHPAEIPAERVAPPMEVLAAYADPNKRTKAAPEKLGECLRTTVEAQPVASVRVKIPEKEVAQNLAVILPEVMGYLSSVGADMAGPPFSRYHERSGGMIDFEAGIPLKKKVEGKGRVQAGELPGGEVAVTWHIGPYQELPKSCEHLAAWMKAEKLGARGGYWEVYWTDPGMEPDPQKWRTQVLWPVKAEN